MDDLGKIFGKPIRWVKTPGVEAFANDIEIGGYVLAIFEIAKKNPIIGMYVFENFKEGDQLKLKVTIEGYNVHTKEYIEPVEVYTSDSREIPKFWLILEDHGKFLLGTFLLPDEY